MAVNWDLLKVQYLKGNRASQLGNLALNLMRLHLLARQGDDSSVAQHLVRESQFFVEWTVPTIDLKTEISSATELLELQRLGAKHRYPAGNSTGLNSGQTAPA